MHNETCEQMTTHDLVGDLQVVWDAIRDARGRSKQPRAGAVTTKSVVH